MNPEVLADTTEPDFEFDYIDISALEGEGSVAFEPRSLTFATAPSRARRVLRPGDVLVSTVRTYLRAVASIDTLDRTTVASTGFAVLRASGALLPRFAYWAVLSEPFIESVVSHSEGVSYPAIAPSALGLLPIVVPPLEAQRAIAAFLDRETARIDALIEKKTRFIELLREKRQALITQAVTRGLDSGVPTKDSGIEWLGAIPAHWDARLIRHVSHLESGHTPDKQTDAYWVDCKIQWVSLSDSDALRTNDYIHSTAKQINELGLANSSARLLPAGTVVMTRDATVGLCSILGETMAVSQHLVAWVPGEQIDSRYLLYAIRAMCPWLQGLTTGATIRTIGMDHIRALVVPLPPVQEQRDIARYILTRSERMDALIEATERSIALLRERRAALITAAVTGQLDVREAA